VILGYINLVASNNIVRLRSKGYSTCCCQTFSAGHNDNNNTMCLLNWKHVITKRSQESLFIVANREQEFLSIVYISAPTNIVKIFIWNMGPVVPLRAINLKWKLASWGDLYFPKIRLSQSNKFPYDTMYSEGQQTDVLVKSLFT